VDSEFCETRADGDTESEAEKPTAIDPRHERPRIRRPLRVFLLTGLFVGTAVIAFVKYPRPGAVYRPQSFAELLSVNQGIDHVQVSVGLPSF
jgi:hypothetical protein